jgi:hypothetical protein
MWERLKVSAEAYAIRGRGLGRTAVQLLGIGAVVLGAYNFLLEPFVVASVILPVYREVILGVLAVEATMLADIALMVVGAILAWII